MSSLHFLAGLVGDVITAFLAGLVGDVITAFLAGLVGDVITAFLAGLVGDVITAFLCRLGRCCTYNRFLCLMMCRRFSPDLVGDQRWCRERSHEAYGKNYSILFPHDEPLAARNMKKDPLHQVRRVFEVFQSFHLHFYRDLNTGREGEGMAKGKRHGGPDSVSNG